MSVIGNVPKYANFTSDYYSGNGVTVTFTLSNPAGSANSVLVIVDGVKQFANSYSLNGAVLTLSEAPATGSTIEVIALGLQGIVNSPADGSVTTAKIVDGNVTTSKILDANVTLAKLEDVAKTSKIQPVNATVATNTMTITLAPTVLDTRSTTLGSGAVTTVSNATSISLVVPNLATLGSVNAVQSRYPVIAMNNSGTLELAIVNIAGGNDLSETGLISTTAISATSTASNVFYSTTARTNVAYRVVGYIESTQATAGTWATAPSTVQGAGGQALAALASLGYGQTWQNVTASRALGTTYYNTTGKPIQIIIFITNSSGGDTVNITVNGVLLKGTSSNAAGVFAYAQAIIPPSATYIATMNSGTGTLSSWTELR